MMHTLFLLLSLPFLSFVSPAHAQEVPETISTISGEVDAGSIENEVRIQIVNHDKENPAKGITVKQKIRTLGISNVTVTPKTIDTLPPGKTGEFTLRFDVSEKLEPGSQHKILLDVTSQEGILSANSAMIEVAIAEVLPEDPVAFNGPRINMVLTEVRVSPQPKEGPPDLKSSGAFHRQKGKHTEWVYSVKLTDYPTSIILGRPFSIGAEVEFTGKFTARQTTEYSNFGQHVPICDTGKKPDESIFPNGAISLGNMNGGYLNTVYIEGDAPLKPDCDKLRQSERDMKTTSKASLAIHLEPVKWSEKEGKDGIEGYYTYSLSPSGSSEPMQNPTTSLRSIQGTPEHRFLVEEDEIARFEFESGRTPEEKYTKFREGKLGPGYFLHNHLEISFGFSTTKSFNDTRITLVYKPSTLVANPLGELTAYSHPQLEGAEKVQEEKEKTQMAKADGKTNETATDPTEIGKDGTRATSGAGTTTGGSTGGKRIKPKILNPAQVNPRDPNIAALIQNWTRLAEPVINAKGGNARYNKWGQVIGLLGGAKTTQDRTPTGAEGMQPAEFVWTLRDKLDSLNHCTVGSYVMRKLNDQSIEDCVGAGIPPGLVAINNVTGMPGKDAKKLLEDKGYKVALKLGPPAKTEKESFSVKQQIPKPGTMSEPGDKVTLTVFAEFTKQIMVPKVTGLSGAKARKKLEDAGFTVKMKTGASAKGPQQSFQVASVTPAEGSKADIGKTIVITTFGPFDDRVTLPKLTGMSRDEAERALRGLGIDPVISSGKKAPSKDQEGKIYEQTPEPGNTISPRQEVKLRVYDQYQFEGPMPNLIGLTSDEVKKKLAPLRLRYTKKVEGIAPNPKQTGRVTSQSTPPGKTVKEGDTITIVLYGKSTEERLTAAECERFPGTKAEWNAKTQKAQCACQEGLEPAKDKQSCVKPKPKIVLGHGEREDFPCTDAERKQPVYLYIAGGIHENLYFVQKSGTNMLCSRNRKSGYMIPQATGFERYGWSNVRKVFAHLSTLMVTERLKNKKTGLPILKGHYVDWKTKKKGGRFTIHYQQSSRHDPALAGAETRAKEAAAREAERQRQEDFKRDLQRRAKEADQRRARKLEAERRALRAQEQQRQEQESLRRAEAERRRQQQAEAEYRARQRQEQARLEQQRRAEAEKQATLQRRCPELYRKVMIEAQRGNKFESLLAQEEAGNIGCDYMESMRVLQPFFNAQARGQQKNFDVDRHLRSMGMGSSGGGYRSDPGGRSSSSRSSGSGKKPASQIPPEYQFLSCSELKQRGYECPDSPVSPGEICIMGQC